MYSQWKDGEFQNLQALPDMYSVSVYGTASLVNVTLNMRYKNYQKYQIHHHQICFFSSS